MRLLLTILTLIVSTAAYADSYPRFQKFITPPSQHKSFCERFPNHCKVIGSKQRAKFTLDTFAKLDHINRWGNHRVVDRVDVAGNDYWTYPADGYGDCDEHAIFKRAHLLSEGFSSSQLLLTVVWSPRIKWHLILTVRTTDGDYVLDNLSEDVLSVEETMAKYGYVYFYRQSVVDPTFWVQLSTADASILKD